MDLNTNENDSSQQIPNPNMEENTLDWNPTTSTANQSPVQPSPSHLCREKCSEFCNSAKCPKYAAISKVIFPEKMTLCNKQCEESCIQATCPQYAMPAEKSICDKQCKQSCTQATCPKYAMLSVEEPVCSGKCICTKTEQICNTKPSKEVFMQKTCHTQSLRSITKSTDTADLYTACAPEKEPELPCKPQPTCIVTKSEYFKTPEPIPHLHCPYCCHKIYVLSRICDSEKSYPMKKSCEATPLSLSSSHLNPCQAKLCIPPTPPAAYPLQQTRNCSCCHPQFPVSQPHKPPRVVTCPHNTCPHFESINSQVALEPVYTDVNGLPIPITSAGNVSIDNRVGKQPNTAAFDLIKTLKTCKLCSGTDQRYHSNQQNSRDNVLYTVGTSNAQRQKNSHKSLNHRSIPQFKFKKQASTMVLYMEPNFTDQRSMSKTNIFYDCRSIGTDQSDTNELETADTFISALKKLTHTARKLLDNFEKAMKNKERKAHEQQHVKLKLKQKYSALQMALPPNDRRSQGEPIKVVLPLSLKIPSSRRNMPKESESIILDTLRTALIVPQTSPSRQY